MLIMLNHVGAHNCIEGKLFQVETLYSLLFAYSSTIGMNAVLTDIRYEKVSLTLSALRAGALSIDLK